MQKPRESYQTYQICKSKIVGGGSHFACNLTREKVKILLEKVNKQKRDLQNQLFATIDM